MNLEFKIKHRPFEYAFWKNDSKFYPGNGDGFWFRIFGWGLWFSNGRLHFSERYGHRKIRKLPFGWRFGFLKRGFGR